MKMKKILGFLVLLMLFAGLLAEVPDWEVIPGTQYSMQMYSQVDYAGDYFTDDNPDNIVAAFGPGGVSDCRAIAFWNENNEFSLWYLNIVSNAEVDQYEVISFKIYDPATDQILDCRETVIFEDNTVVGSLEDNFLLTIPTIFDDQYDIYEDTELNISAAEGVLANDYFSDYIEEFVVYLDDDAENGTLTLNADGSFDYMPNENFYGSDYFHYHASDGTYITDIALVTINVVPVNDPPEIDLPDEGFTFPEDTSYQVDFSIYVSDIDNDSLSIVFGGNEYIGVEVDGYNVNFVPETNFHGTENITFTLSDGISGRAIDQETVPVTVTPVNDAPEIRHPVTDFSFNEDTIDSHIDLNYTFKDIDGDQLSFDVLDNINLNVDIDEFGLVAISTFLENWNGEETIVFTASDTQYTVSDTVTVTVLPINDPPEVLNEIPDQNFSEDFADYDIYLNDYFIDVDEDSLHFSAMYNEQHVIIAINNDNNVLTISAVSNWSGTTQVTVTADDRFDRYTVSDTFTINVQEENDPPVVLSPLTNVEMLEDGATRQKDLNYHFGDYDNDPLEFEVDFVVSEMNAWIQDDYLYFQPVADWNGESTITVTASDLQDEIFDDFLVTVIPVNDAPYVYEEIIDYNLEENFTAFDIDLYDHFADIDSDSLMFTVNLDVQHSVNIDIVGEIMTISPVAQWNGSVNVTVTAQDEFSSLRLTASDTFIINVEPVNEPPYLYSEIDDKNVLEDFDPFDIDLQEYFADPENDPLSFEVIFNQNEIDADVNGNILTISSVLNWFGSAEVTVIASDEIPGNEAASDLFLVNVQSVNDEPFVQTPIDDSNVLEDFDPIIIDLDLHFTDVDDVLSYDVQFDADVIQASTELNVLTINNLPNVYGNTLVSVTADDGNRAQISDDFWVNITPVNDPPSINLPDSFQFLEDTSLDEDFSFYVSDIDSDSLTLEAEGNVNVLVDINGLIVTFTNIENWNGSEIITFEVSDDEFSVSDDVEVIVMPEADELTIDLPDSFTFNEDESITRNFANYISNPDDFVIELTYYNDDDVLVDINNLMVEFSAPADYFGSDFINFTISNVNGPEMSSDVVEIIVLPVNDPPVVNVPIQNQFILEDSGVHTIILSDHFDDVDEDSLEYSVNFIGTELDVEIVNNYELNFEPQNDWFGTSTVFVTAQDGVTRVTVTDTFDVIVEAVNDAPYVVSYLDNVTKNEDFLTFTVDFTGNFEDVDNETLDYSVDFDENYVEVVLNGTILEISSVLNWNGSTVIEVTADDGINRLSVTDDFTLLVNPVNDPPVIDVSLDDLYLLEDFDTQYIDLDQHFSDPDNDLTFYAYGEATEITLLVNGNFLELSSVSNWSGSTDIEVIANDLQGRAIVSDDFTVYVEAVNDAPIVQTQLEDIEIQEDTVSDPIDLDLFFFDADGDDLSYSSTVSDSNGIVNIDQNIMTVTASENWYGSFDVTITADDQMGRAVISDVFEVMVTQLNDPPYIVVPFEDLFFDEDFTPQQYDLSMNYGDTECDQLYYNAQYMISEIGITFEGSIMTINSADNWYGETEVILSISDHVCRSTIDDTFIVTVNPVNDAPYVQDQIPDKNKFEDFETFFIELDDYFFDIDDEILSYSAVASDTIVSLEIQDNLLYISAVLNLYGIVDITVTANDGHTRLTVDDTFVLNISFVNDPPMLILPEQYDFDEDTSLVVDLVETGCVCDVDNDPEDLDLNSSGGVNVFVNITGTVVTFSADTDWYGTEDIVFSLADEVRRYVVYDTVTILVNPVNDPPVMIDIPNQTISEGSQFTPVYLDNYVADVDDPDETLDWSFDGNIELIVDIDDNRVATISAPDENWNGNETITFIVTDSGELTDSDPATYIIIAVNDAPEVFLPIPDQFVEINFAPFDIDLTDHFVDVDDDPLTYQIDFNADEVSIAELNGIMTISSVTDWYGTSEVVVTANDNAVRATVSDTFLVDITYTITQDIQLGVMWNWISFYVQPEDYSLEYVFSPLGDNVVTVKYQSQSADYIPMYNDWAGNLQEIQDGAGYLVNVNEPDSSFSLSGNKIMVDTPIELGENWNWIAYYPQATDSLYNALVTIVDNLETVKAQQESADYYPQYNSWFGNLKTMSPSIGYKVKMLNPDTLIYPLNPVVTRSQFAQCLPVNVPQEWKIMPGNSDNMIAMLSLELDGEPFVWTSDNAVGVFDENNVCRAHGYWQEHDALEQGFWYFTIVGNMNGTPLYIKILTNGEEYCSEESIIFNADSKIGDPNQPVLYSFYPTAKDENDVVTVNSLKQNYPNPFNPVTTIAFTLAETDNVEIAVYNLRGEKVKVLVRELREAGSYSVVWNGSDDQGNSVASGIYFYSIKTSKFSATRKMVMIK